MAASEKVGTMRVVNLLHEEVLHWYRCFIAEALKSDLDGSEHGLLTRQNSGFMLSSIIY